MTYTSFSCPYFSVGQRSRMLVECNHIKGDVNFFLNQCNIFIDSLGILHHALQSFPCLPSSSLWPPLKNSKKSIYCFVYTHWSMFQLSVVCPLTSTESFPSCTPPQAISCGEQMLATPSHFLKVWFNGFLSTLLLLCVSSEKLPSLPYIVEGL